MSSVAQLRPAEKETAAPTIQMVPIGRLFESPLNPRKHFDETKLQELADTLKDAGRLDAPIIVRERVVDSSSKGIGEVSGFEIAAGARRTRAAKLAGFTAVPCIVRRLDDKQMLELMLIENIQREDLSALEESNALKSLMDLDGLDVAGVAKKIRKSGSYVYARLKLADLVPEAQKALADGHITPGHAILIARADADKQRDVVKQAAQWGAPSVRELAEDLEEHAQVALSGAPWKLTDASLLPDAGPCSVCPKNTSAQQSLIPGKDGQQCIDPACFRRKLDAWTANLSAQLEREGKAYKLVSVGYVDHKPKGVLGRGAYKRGGKKCAKQIKGIVAAVGPVYGEDKKVRLGSVVDICIDKSCTTHWSTYDRERFARDAAKGRESRAAEEKEREERRARNKATAAGRQRLVEAVVAKVAALTPADIALVAERVRAGHAYELQRTIGRKTKPAAVIIAWLLSEEIGSEWNLPKVRLLPEFARRYGVKFESAPKADRAAGNKKKGGRG